MSYDEGSNHPMRIEDGEEERESVFRQKKTGVGVGMVQTMIKNKNLQRMLRNCYGVSQ
jgi:hypothetical protein